MMANARRLAEFTTASSGLDVSNGRLSTVADEVRAFEENCISPEMAAIYRQKTPTERLQIGFGMWRAARRLVAASVRQQHPDWSDDEASREIARRMSHGFA